MHKEQLNCTMCFHPNAHKNASFALLSNRKDPSPNMWLRLLVHSSLLLTTESLASRPPKRKGSSKPDASSSRGFGKAKPSAPCYIPDTSNSIQELLSFLETKECEGIGAREGTEIGFHPSTLIRGLYACDTFEAGDFLLGIPFPACLTLAMDDLTVTKTFDAELGMRLLEYLEQQQSNDFGPYFQCLPTRDQQFDASPDFWTDHEIDTLEFPLIIEKAKQRKQEIQQVATAHQVDPEQLQFATWLVKSRGFTLVKPIYESYSSVPESANTDEEDLSSPEKGTILSKTLLMPYLDMINHSADKANAELQVLETKAEDESMYALQAIRRIPKGTEITLCYGTGQESSVELLSNYGFCTENNPNDIDFRKDWKGHKWSTSVEEDMAELGAIVSNSDYVDKVRTKVLEFRIQMKRAMATDG
jgi:SET domain